MITVKGKHSVLEALQSRVKVFHIYISQNANMKDLKDIKGLAAKKGVPISTLSKDEISKKFRLDGHQSVIANVQDVPLKSLQDIIAKKPPLIVVLDHLEDPYNVGAIMRTCNGLGVEAMIFPKDRNASLNAGVIKASSGAAYLLDLVQVSNIAQSLKRLDQEGYWIYSLDSNKGQDLDKLDPAFPAVIVLGNEHKGLSSLVSKQCHEHINIPMKGQIDSLNVSVATGIMLYHFTKKL